MKKFVTLLLVMVMILSMAATASAQEVDSAAGGAATITITNASKGETYAVYKLFDATVTGTEGGSIAYTGEIPASLSAYFTKDTAGNIALAENVENADLFDALGDWAASATAVKSAVSDGSELTFTNLKYGYYVVTSTQGESAITVTSTNPNASIVDKNKTTPVTNLTKTANEDDVSIGDTVTYTVKFGTANYAGEGEAAKQIVSYTITDTLPAGVTLNSVSSITVGGTAITTQQFENGKITIKWVDENGNNLYANGAEIEITYTVTVNDQVAIDGEGNKNEVTITYETEDGSNDDKYTTDETIYTYAIALKKVDQEGKPLAGATFQLPFYVKATAAADGAYIYAGTTAGEGLVNELTTPENGLIIVKGVETGTYSITETVAPNGYNKLTAPVSVTATKTGETTTSTTTYLDENGEVVETQEEAKATVTVEISNLAATAIVVVNKAGTELPSTGGVGTTMFYVIGGLMMLMAVVLLVTKKRMASAE